MEKRVLGRTGWEISVISFGAIKLSRLSQKKCDILLNQAIDSGINYVDTADCYGDSEEKIGRALGARRKEFYLSTKIDERDGAGVRKKLDRCLKRSIRTGSIWSFSMMFAGMNMSGSFQAVVSKLWKRRKPGGRSGKSESASIIPCR